MGQLDSQLVVRLAMPNQYCPAVIKDKIEVIFGQESPNLYDPYYTVLPYCMMNTISAMILLSLLLLIWTFRNNNQGTTRPGNTGSIESSIQCENHILLLSDIYKHNCSRPTHVAF